jgi:hypothetical protein
MLARWQAAVSREQELGLVIWAVLIAMAISVWVWGLTALWWCLGIWGVYFTILQSGVTVQANAPLPYTLLLGRANGMP